MIYRRRGSYRVAFAEDVTLKPGELLMYCTEGAPWRPATDGRIPADA